MKKLVFLFFALLTFCACKDKDFVLEPAVGSTNQLTVIIEDALWNGEVGDTLRKKLAKSIKGLPQEEPLFSLIQHRDRTGEDHFCKNRNILIVEKSTEDIFEIRHNDFALNQSVIYLSGRNIPEIIALVESKSDSIIKTIKSFEIYQTQKSIRLAALDNQKINQKFNISLNIPNKYHYMSESQDFLWLKKENQNGSCNLLIYKVPYFDSAIQTENIHNIISVRDSIGEKFIHSRESKNQSYMATEESYAPYFSITKIGGVKAYQTKGTWELKDVFMSGPFVNYTLLDKKNNRNIVIEGFIYAPSSSKRDMMHELEAIIQSVEFN
ncbi:MAG TPA: DUF4837 family protein [Flavobacterium sp.]|nr:DUF4837 family protein [Flavobacterium sp.]